MEIVDLKGFKCPIPILKTKKALAKLRPGDTICIWTTDENAETDFEQFCKRTGHVLQESSLINSEYYQIVIRHK